MYQGKPVIGIMPLYDEEKESIWMLPGYVNGALEQDAVPLILPLSTDSSVLDYFLDNCDGFLFTGGHDVDPSCYGSARTAACGLSLPERDQMETYLLRHAARRNLAVLGICRGIQLLNAVYGGTLYQDLPTEHSSPLEHHMTPPYDRAIHTVKLCPNTPLHALLQCETLGVNSYHHQAIQTLSPQLRPMAYAEDGLIEAVYLPNRKFVWGIQWHPEFSYRVSEESRKIFAAWIAAAKAE